MTGGSKGGMVNSGSLIEAHGEGEVAGSLAADHIVNVTVEQREINGDVRV